MKRHAKAKIKWLLPEMGGRAKPPVGPKGARYTTISHFENDRTCWPESTWSLVVQFEEPSGKSSTTMATVWFLSPEAPQDILQIGARFELLEGNRIVAKGEILG